ncbi:UNVERIFIED_CONTAM: hypothetical protein DES50_108143 [Williamsia faeni]
MSASHQTATANRSSKRIWRATAMVTATTTSVLALAGAIGVAGGGTRFGEEIESRLPWQSPVFAGIALAVVVGIPTALAAFTLWRNTTQAALITLIAGFLLVGWIAVQIAVIQTFNPLQVVFGLVGFQLVAAGSQMASTGTPPRDELTH